MCLAKLSKWFVLKFHRHEWRVFDHTRTKYIIRCRICGTISKRKKN